MLKTNKQPNYAFSRLMYIFEAAIEHFIALTVSSVYLATIAKDIGMPDGLTAILSSFVSLGCGFQLIALFLANKRPVKIWVTISHTLSQLLFACIYLVPIFPMSTTAKTIAFFVVFFSAYIIHYAINSPKINWFMSLVDDKKRGRFTANKEIVSLAGGMIFSYLMGSIMDYFKYQNNIKMAFVVGATTILTFTVLHTLTLILSKEKPVEEDFKPLPLKKTFKNLITNKTLIKVIFISIIWAVANAPMNFMATYKINELGFSLTFCSVIIMVGSFARILFSKPMGALADKTSFAKSLTVSFIIAGIGYLINAFSVRETGAVTYFVYYVLHCIAMAGINSATINLIYDYVDKSERTAALALKSTFSGFVGFFTVLTLTPVFTAIQNNGNKVFGLPIYAQQLFSVISFFIIVLLVIYMQVVIKKLPKKTNN